MAETVYVLCDNGSVMPHDLPLPSGIADRVGRGDLRLVNADGTPLADGEPEPAAEPEPPKEPGKSASKEAWVAYALAIDPDITDEDAQAMTRDGLAELYGTK
jgi:hypothetical protein